MSKQELKDIMDRVWGSNVYKQEVTDNYEISKKSIRDDDVAKEHLKDLKARGFYTKKKSYSEFTAICGIKKKGF